ncbi:MAG: capsular polysaccharide export protein [Paraglaciecola sp.]|jgi:capsular polysaccharide export protein
MDKTYWAASSGILNKHALISACLQSDLKKLSGSANLKANDVIVGWGLKANTQKAKEFAKASKLKYLHLEDGFIGYIGHPARNGQAISLIADELGVYYDARQPSSLESFIAQPLTSVELARSEKLISTVVDYGITKYNCYESATLPSALSEKLALDTRPYILIVDQVAGDLSIAGAMADENSFVTMVEHARKNHPDARLLLRTHPDTRLGKKRGVLAQLALTDVEVVHEHCHPHGLIKAVKAVYTVSSQMGFEALLLGKKVHCFGLPFYAGWGLTQDTLPCERRGSASLEQLVYAAMVKYTRYYDPVLKEKCEVEAAIELIKLQHLNYKPYSRLYLVGFSWWKRAFMKGFAAKFSNKLCFVRTPPKTVKASEQVLVWGAKYPELYYPELSSCIRVEDGFIRSSGLGANLSLPSSLSFDHAGIYFDARQASDLENLLNQYQLSDNERLRANTLLSLLRESGVSKYNVGSVSDLSFDNGAKPIMLVVGQVDGDASIVTGSSTIKTNEALIYAVKAAHPAAYIVYKPHPDVVSGNRQGLVSQQCVDDCIDNLVTHHSLIHLYPHIDALHTMTSLSGFEALIRGVVVHTWGQPFYAGWGITQDHYPPLRRSIKRTVEELVFISIAFYPDYIDWDTGLNISPETLIQQLARTTNKDFNKRTFVQRTWLKATYLKKAFW